MPTPANPPARPPPVRSRSRVLRPRVNRDDLYLSRIVKYIPTEVIMAYIASIGFVKTMVGTQQRLWSWATAMGLLILTLLWTMRAASVAGQATPTRLAIAATLAFAAWTFATGGPLSSFNGIRGLLVR
jgi:hypothetical protein